MMWKEVFLWLGARFPLHTILIIVLSGIAVLVIDRREMEAFRLLREAQWCRVLGWTLIVIAIVLWVLVYLILPVIIF